MNFLAMMGSSPDQGKPMRAQMMRLTRYPSAALIGLLVWCAAAHVDAKGRGDSQRSGIYFQDCHRVMANPANRALAQYVDRLGHRFNPDDLSANLGQCYALNGSEFVVIPKTSHANLGSMYYCDFKSRGICSPYQYNAQLPALKAVREFNGADRQHFVLFETQYVEHGFFAHDYYAFYLTLPSPSVKKGGKSERGLPFTLQHLVGVKGLSDGLCGEGLDSRHATTTDFKGAGYRIEHVGSPRFMLTFDLVKKSCKGGEQVSFQQRFIFRDGAFIQQAMS